MVIEVTRLWPPSFVGLGNDNEYVRTLLISQVAIIFLLVVTFLRLPSR